MTTPQLEAELKLDEGVRSRPYRDSVGKLTIGVGRNLDDVGLGADEIALMLSNDIRRAEAGLDARLPWWRTLDDVRQDVLANMAFNMGAEKLCAFRAMLEALEAGSVERAAKEMLNSRWAAQVGDRAKRLAEMMRSGQR